MCVVHASVPLSPAAGACGHLRCSGEEPAVMLPPGCCSDPAPGPTVSLEEPVLAAVPGKSRGLTESVHAFSLTALQTGLQGCTEEQNS